MGFLDEERDRIVAASIERAAQRERDQHEYPGDGNPKKVARQMWRDFLADQAVRTLSSRALAARYSAPGAVVPGEAIIISHDLANDIRNWIFKRTAFPADLVPEVWRKRQREKAAKKSSL